MKKLYTVMNKISDFLEKPTGFLSALCLFAGLLALFFQVLYRYVIIRFVSFQFPFTEEFARYTIIWFTYIICGVCLKEGSMVSLSILYDKLPRVPRLILYFFTRILMLIFVAVVIYFGFKYMPTALKFKSIMLRLPGLYLYSFPILGAFLMGYEILVDTVGVISGELEPFESRGNLTES